MMPVAVFILHLYTKFVAVNVSPSVIIVAVGVGMQPEQREQ
jgi:hypothetical protein